MLMKLIHEIYFFDQLFATHSERVCDPLLGRAPVENHWSNGLYSGLAKNEKYTHGQ